MEVLIQKLHQKTFADFKIEVVAVITNNPQAKGIARAKKHALPVIVIDHREFESREAFDRALVLEIEMLDVDLVVLAGFMRILTAHFTANIRAINVHPSLLPAFKGADALKRSFDGEDSIVGVSVHFVVQEVDGGEIIMQKSFDKSGMDFERFQEKIHDCEHEIFSKAVVKVLAT